MTVIASASAAPDSAGVRSDAPIATAAAANPPAPSPSTARPPVSRSRDAAARASTAGGRSSRLCTFAEMRMRVVRAPTQDISVHVSRKRGWYGWSWNVTNSRPASSVARASATVRSGSSAEGVTKVPNSRGRP